MDEIILEVAEAFTGQRIGFGHLEFSNMGTEGIYNVYSDEQKVLFGRRDIRITVPAGIGEKEVLRKNFVLEEGEEYQPERLWRQSYLTYSPTPLLLMEELFPLQKYWSAIQESGKRFIPLLAWDLDFNFAGRRETLRGEESGKDNIRKTKSYYDTPLIVPVAVKLFSFSNTEVFGPKKGFWNRTSQEILEPIDARTNPPPPIRQGLKRKWSGASVLSFGSFLKSQRDGRNGPE